MSIEKSCPMRQQALKFVLGKLGPEEERELRQYLDDCHRCYGAIISTWVATLGDLQSQEERIFIGQEGCL